MHRNALALARSSCIVVSAILIAGCGGSDDGGAGAAGASAGTQQQLDELTDALASDMDALEEAYPEDDSDDDAVFGAFEDALVSQDGVGDLERIDDWKLDTPLPCGESDQPDRAVLATGADEELFVGRANAHWIAGFAEDADGDIGTVVAACRDGKSGELHVVADEGDDPSARISTLSFAADGSPVARVIDRFLADPGTTDPSPDAVMLDRDWSIDDPVPCATGDDIVGIATVDASGMGAFGFASSDAVALTAEVDGQDTGSFVAECDGGTATGFRRIARPVNEAQDDGE